MSTSEVLPTYWFGQVVKGRAETNHGFTIKSLVDLRRKQQLAPIMISFNWATPFFNATHRSIQQLEDECKRNNKQPAQEDLLPIVTNAAKTATAHWAGVLIRVGLQTAMASALIHKNTPVGNSVVLQWDTYPRMHQKYMGDFLQSIWLPRSIASLMGPATKPEDIALWETETSPIAAAQDSLKRHALITVSNFVVTLVVHAATNGVKVDRTQEEAVRKAMIADYEKRCKAMQAAQQPNKDGSVDKIQFPPCQLPPSKLSLGDITKMTLLSEGFSLIGCVVGAAAGRLIGGGRAEYWSEFLGCFTFATAGTLASAALALNGQNIHQFKN